MPKPQRREPVYIGSSTEHLEEDDFPEIELDPDALDIDDVKILVGD